MWLLTIVVALLCACTAEGAYCCENSPVADCEDCIKIDPYDNVNMIILVPHGGNKFPDGLQNRSSNGCYSNAWDNCTYTHTCQSDDSSKCKVVTITDSYTINLSKRIMDGVKQHLGHSPMRLVNWVKRIMLDPNRDLDEGTFQNPYAVELFNLYRNNITYLIEKAGGKGCLVLDLHGMGSSNPNMTQLGMRLLNSHLKWNDTELMGKVNDSSIKHLSGYSGEKFVSFLRGNDSLAKAMQDNGLLAIPSPAFPNMPEDYTYFGAYNSPITGIYSNLEGHPADVIQMEVHYDIRKSTDPRNDFGDKLAAVLADFIRLHYVVTCSASTVNNAIPDKTTIDINTNVEYTCDTDYTYSSGSLTRTCTTGGILSGEDPICTLVTCSASTVNNAIPDKTTIDINTNVEYACDTGYTHSSGSLTRTCTTGGILSGEDPICTLVTCSASTVNNAIPDKTTIDINTNVEYTCDTDYTYSSGSLTRTCTTGGILSGEEPLCTLVTCSASTVNNAIPDKTTIDINTNVEYACDTGYTHSSGSLTRTCTTGGILSGEDPICTLVTCSASTVNNAIPDKTTIDINTNVEYACDTGYTHSSGSLTRTCTTGGILSGEDPICTLVTCSASTVNNAIPDKTTIDINTNVEYACDTGYTHSSGSLTRTCTTGGILSGEDPICTLVTCSASTVNNAIPDKTTIDINTNVEYACDTGYTHSSGSLTRTCTTGGILSGEDPICTLVTCSASTVNNAIPDKTTIDINTNVEYACDTGYTHSSGSLTRTCTTGGILSGEDPICTLVTCSASTVNNAIPDKTTIDINTNVEYACDTGYTHSSGSLTRTCTTGGILSGEDPICTLVTCSASTVNNAIPDKTTIDINTNVEYACDTGYTHSSGSLTRTCTTGGILSGEDPICTLVTCSASTVNNAIPDKTTIDINTNVEYACHTGYTHSSGSLTRTCTTGGILSGEDPICTLVTCSASTVNNAIPDKTTIDINTNVEYACDTGYTHSSGSLTRTCTTGGILSGEDPICTLVTCSASTVNNAIPDKTTIDINTNVEYACDTGYTHSSGSLTRTCTTGGILSGEDPICTLVTCSASTVNNAIPDKTTIDINTNVEYACDTGYTHSSGSLTRACTTGGILSGEDPICTLVTCSASTVNNAIPDKTTIDINTNVEYACDTGYTHSSGSLTRMCTTGGILSGEDPICTFVTCSASPMNNAQPDKTAITYNSSAVYTCDQGYIYSSGDLKRRCEANGTLVGTVPSCVNPPSQKCYTFNWVQRQLRNVYDVFNSRTEANQKVCLLLASKWTTGCGSCKYDCCEDVNECDYEPCKDGCKCVNYLGDFKCVRKRSLRKCRRGQFSIDIHLEAIVIPAVLPISALIAFARTQQPVIAILAALQSANTAADIYSAWQGSLNIAIGIESDIEAFDPKTVIQETLDNNNFTDIKVDDAVKIEGVVCDVGYERDNTNQTCRECSPGSFSNTPFGFPCISCEPGNYQDEEGQTECKACPAGYFEKENGSIQCKACAVGHYSTEMSINCTKCDPGSYSTEGSASCTLCDDGSVPNDNQSGCEQCSAGTFATSGDDECQQCEPGSYSTEGSASCTLCDDGSVPNDNQSGCEQCSAGTFATSGDDECQQCNPGSYSTEGSASCTLCDDGSVPNDNQSGCEQCSAGTFATSGDDECQQCNPGSYSTEGSASCTLCDDGSVPNDNQSGCEQCSAGTFATSGDDECQQCNPGSYSTEGSGSCSLCDNGSVPNDNQSGCEQCSAGTFATSGDDECQQCEPGSYSTEGSASCTLCDNGSVPNDNQSGCEQCLAGTFATSGDDECQQCEPGSYSTEGSVSCTLCDDGSVPNDNQSGCEQCSAGTFATSGDDECQQCNPGSYSTEGSASCTLCDNGSVPNDNQSGCEQCSAGTFATSGDDKCQQCVPGSYSTEGSTSCSLCNNGSVPNDNQSGCEECEAGTFAMSGSVSCQECQVDKVSSAGAAYCEECPIGYMPSREQTSCTQNLAFNKTTDQKFSKGSSKSDEGSSNSDKRSSNSDNQGRDQESEKMGGNSKSGSRDSVKKRGKRSTSGRRDSGKGSSRKSVGSNKGIDNGDSDNAVDGIFYDTCSHSSNGKKTWWIVDLGDLYNVTGVVIQSNMDCCEGELRDITVYVGNKKNDRKSMNVWGKYAGPALPGERIYITRIKPIVGRYVTIYRESNNNKAYLTLCEVFVLGNKAPVSNPKKNSTKGSKSSHSD